MRVGWAPRENEVETGGGTRESEAAVDRRTCSGSPCIKRRGILVAGHAFNEHARKQLDDKDCFDDKSAGKGGKNDTAGTAFGLLPFLAAGITHKLGRRKAEETYVKTVKSGIELSPAKAGQGRVFPGGMYAHALATMAVCEAYGLSADPASERSAKRRSATSWLPRTLKAAAGVILPAGAVTRP